MRLLFATLFLLLALPLTIFGCTDPRTGALDDDDVADDDDATSGDPGEAMVGQTYCLDWSTANITEPPNIGDLLAIGGIDLNDYPLLLNPTGVDGSFIDFLGGAALTGTCQQDMSLSTFVIDDASWVTPHFESQPSSLIFNAGTFGTLALEDSVLDGDFTGDASQIIDSSMTGFLDVTALTGACLMLTCSTCPSGSGDCAAFEFDSAVWNNSGLGPLTPVP